MTKKVKIDGSKLQTLVEEYLKTRDSHTAGKVITQLQPFLKVRAKYICSLTHLEFEDVMQDLAIVVLGRLEKYRPERKAKFLTYLFSAMRGDPTENLQRMVKKKRGGDGKSQYMTLLSLHQPQSNEEGEERTLQDIQVSNFDPHKEMVFEHDVTQIQNSKKTLYKYLKRP